MNDPSPSRDVPRVSPGREVTDALDMFLYKGLLLFTPEVVVPFI